MNFEEFKKTIKENFNLNDETEIINKILIYKDFLIEQNKIHNLTRLSTEDKIYEQYFWNSLMPFVNVDMHDKKILDIGSGSGIPGIILKIIEPSIKLTIMDANQKKLDFIKSLCEKLNFNDVTILNQRAESIKKEQREYFDIVTSRAVANLAILVEISSPYLKVNGLMIEPKSVNYENEWEQIKDRLDEYGIKLDEIKKLDDKNFVFYLSKIKPTNTKYPRTWNQIIKDYKNVEK